MKANLEKKTIRLNRFRFSTRSRSQAIDSVSYQKRVVFCGMVLILALACLTSYANQAQKYLEISSQAQEKQMQPGSEKIESPVDKDRRIAVNELEEMLGRDEVVVVDVRDEKSWRAGHLKMAKWIPRADIDKRADELDRSKMIVTYCSCKAEYSAARAILQLEKKGFKRTAALIGGYEMAVHYGIPSESSNE
jgi:rhodanese-related sulfurtransferase